MGYLLMSRRFPWSLPLLCGGLPLLSCSSPLSTHTPMKQTPLVLSGHLQGGQQPVANSTVQLYTVGILGDGSASTPLLTSTVTSDINGNFTLGGLFSCSNADIPHSDRRRSWHRSQQPQPVHDGGCGPMFLPHAQYLCFN